jgi:hypothetical protein
MNEFEACADFCDDQGFPRQAALVRSVGRGKMHAYAVCERALNEDGFLEESEGGIPRVLFVNREDAEHEARRREILAFRERNLYEYCYENDLSYTTGRTDDDLKQEFAAILGDEYTLPDPEGHQGSIFPADATDDQIRALIQLFEIKFFYVVALDFMGRANPDPHSESLP